MFIIITYNIKIYIFKYSVIGIKLIVIFVTEIECSYHIQITFIIAQG